MASGVVLATAAGADIDAAADWVETGPASGVGAAARLVTRKRLGSALYGCHHWAMSANPQPQQSVRDQVWSVADPQGEVRALIDTAFHAPDAPSWVAFVGADLSEQWSQVRAAGSDYRALMADIEAALELLVPRGWAVVQMQTDAVREAVNLVRSDKGADADVMLAGQWEGEKGAWRTERVCDRVRLMCAGDAEYNRLFRLRAQLLMKAKEHHAAGRYDASIPIIQAQMEGLVMDVVPGKKFFTKSTTKVDLVDPTQLVSVEASLAALQATYGQNVDVTQAEGSLSRHGVAHGRELAYDTRVNSAKTWSVLDALVEWAMPRGRAMVDQRVADRQAANAGSQEVDEDGRRVDDREFSETREMLRLLSVSAMGWHRQHGRFRDDVVGGVYQSADFVKRGLPVAHCTEQRVGLSGQEVVFWRETISGWVLGIAISHREGRFEERYFAGPSAPGGGPSALPGVWSSSLPDWP